MKKRYRVALHAHATAVVFVEASDAQEAGRLAIAEVKAGRGKVYPIKEWTPVAAADLSRKW
ncbi:hypothetical protein AB0E08_03640 [Streptomyces sp. NPDC048281]|uniref:hypothetical protein n=1 Tax=Streptomyces sp. NPDC048281 TaxID=3154715 RepID=UPI00343146CC